MVLIAVVGFIGYGVYENVKINKNFNLKKEKVLRMGIKHFRYYILGNQCTIH